MPPTNETNPQTSALLTPDASNATNSRVAERQAPPHDIEPYKLSEIFSLIPDFDGNPIFLNTFLNSCTTAFDMTVGEQSILLTIHIKNRLKGRASELVNSRNPETWEDIRELLETYFTDTRDLNCLMADLQRMRQLSNESPLTFIARVQTHESKMISVINKSYLSAGQKCAQSMLIQSMCLNTLLTGLEPKLGQLIRASNPTDMMTAISRVKRELQLNYFENQKFSNPKNNIPKRPLPQLVKVCSFCKRTGHVFNECRQRQQQFQQPTQNPNFRPNFQPQTFQSQRPIQNNNPNFNRSTIPSQNFRQPSNLSPNFRQNPNPNFRPNTNSNNFRPPQRTHHINQSDYYTDNNQSEYQNQYDNFNPNQYDQNNQSPLHENYYPANSSQYDNQYDQYDTNYCFDTNASNNSNAYCLESDTNYNFDNNSNFEISPCTQNENFPQATLLGDPPYTQIQTDLDSIQNQVQTLNLDDWNPNLNIPEQKFI